MKNFKAKSICFWVLFTKAVKGNTIVPLNKSRYTEKTLDLIFSSKYSKLKKDSIERFQRDVKHINLTL